VPHDNANFGIGTLEQGADVVGDSRIAGETDNFFIAPLSGVELPSHSPVRRELPPLYEQRASDYDRNFDWLSLFYDVYRQGEAVAAIGPPLRNLAALVAPGYLRLDGAPVPAPKIRSFGNTDLLLIPSAGKPQCLDIDCGWFRTSAIVQRSETGVFAGRKVLCTISRDNRLQWIADWAEFHVKAHGADAVLFYDNASTSYTPADLLALFRSIPGLKVAVVVPWNYKFGLAGKSTKDWDTDNAQYVMLEHARRRFLADAAAMVNLDVDELVVTDDGISLFEHLARAADGILIYPGRWICNVRNRYPENIRHRCFRYYDSGEKPYLNKWTAVPSRLKDTAELGVHAIRHAMPPDPHPSIVFRHFRAVSTSWKYPRMRRKRYNHSRHKVDEALVRQMRAIGWMR